MEDKQKICDALCEALKMTNEYSDLIELKFNDFLEAVTAVFPNCWIEINVAMDSGIAMVRDILKTLQEEC